ncbi:MAG: hypothetical protein II809_05735 [Bacteroidales bacterium]|nr:hypothetical protein [Bacteroidales bacterium]
MKTRNTIFGERLKKNGSVYIEGKAFEVTAFSAEPSYEGLIVSLNGLMEVSK